MSFIFRNCKRFLVKLSPAFYASRNKLYVDFTNKHLESTANQKSLKMLDVGGSDGSLASLSYESLASIGFNVFVVVLDLSSKALRDGKTVHSVLNYICGDVTHLPFNPNAFDIVCSYSVFEHLDKPKDAAKEMARVSKGLCVVQIPNMRFFIEPHTKTPFLFLFPSLVRTKIVQITGIPYFLNFNVTPANLIRWFKQAKFDLTDNLDIYHTAWTRLFRTPQGYLYAFSHINMGRGIH